MGEISDHERAAWRTFQEAILEEQEPGEEISQRSTFEAGYHCGYMRGQIEGLAVAFGLMGMAEAIREQRRCTCPPSPFVGWTLVCQFCKGYP